MGEFDFGVDCIYAPLDITTDNNTIVVEEDPNAAGSSPVDVTIDAGRYWNTLSPTNYTPNNNRGLLDKIQAELNAQLTGSYSITDATPPNTDLPKSGINIGVEGLNDKAVFKFTHSNQTLDPRLLGFAGKVASSGTGFEGYRDITIQTASNKDSPFTTDARFQTYNLIGGVATKKERIPMKRVEQSSDDRKQSRAQTLNAWDKRILVYEFVPGALVKENRGDDEGSAGNVSLNWISDIDGPGSDYGDTHNDFESLWDRMTSPGANDKFAELIYVHDDGDQGHDISTQSREHTRLLGPLPGLSDPKQLYQLQSPKGEYYKLQFEMYITNAVSYDQ